MTSIHCLNCGTNFRGNYCSHCGQKATVGRLTWKTVLAEFVHFFTHAEHSFVYTSKRLIANPGSLMKDFLEGKRKLVHKPITFLLVWAAVDQLAIRSYNYFVKHFNLYEFPASDPTLRILWKGYKNPAVTANEAWTTLLIQAPMLVLLGWLIFRKTRTSFVERWVIIVYGTCATIMLSVVMRTVTFVLRLLHAPISKGMVNDGYFICYQVMITWVIYSFSKTYKPKMPEYQQIIVSFLVGLLANYASDLAIYLLYRFAA